MVLVQIPIYPATNNSIFPIGIAGKCSIRVLSVQYYETTGNHKHMISIQSDALYFPYSPAKYITFVTGADATVALDQGHEEYHLKNCVINGGIRLYVVNRATGETPANFGFCLLSLSIEHLNETLE